ncbi:MAG: flavodoxin [Bacteroidetes bacterium]|nr:flavodoxin [Bacteroidota bacterium]
MEKIGIIYWPKGGNVEKIAHKIYNRFDEQHTDIFDLTSIEVIDLVNYDRLIIGGSTVGAEIWQEAKANNKWVMFFNNLDKINLKRKKVAIFGLGNQVLYPNNFVDGIAIIKEEFDKRGAQCIGAWPTKGYAFTDSIAVENDKFFGLAIDEDTQANLTDQRLYDWIKQLKVEI